MGPLEDMALKKDMGVLIQLSQVRRALGALLGKVEGAAKRESVHPSIQLDSSPKAALAQNVGRLFLGGLAKRCLYFGREEPQSPVCHLENSEGGRLSKTAQDSLIR